MLYSPTTTEIEKMNRTDIVFELSKHCHIDHYHSVITMPTEILRNLLSFYKNDDGEMIEKVIDFNKAITKKINFIHFAFATCGGVHSFKI